MSRGKQTELWANQLRLKYRRESSLPLAPIQKWRLVMHRQEPLKDTYIHKKEDTD